MSYQGTVAALGAKGDTNSRSVYTCELTGSPSAGNLVLVGVIVNDAGGSATGPSSVSGLGMVFVSVSSVSFGNTAGTETHHLSLWRGMASSPSGSVVSVALASPNGCAIVVDEVSVVSQSGTSGSKAAGQSSVSFNTNNNSAVTLIAPSAASTQNGWYAIDGLNANDTGDLPADKWSLSTAAAFTANGTGIHSGFTTLSTATRSYWTGTGAVRRATILVELVGDNPIVAGVATTYNRQVRQSDRLPPVPVTVTGELGTYLKNVVRILNAEAYISKFSGTNPNTSGVTGLPGNLLLNVGSASSWTRLWVMGGSIASIDTNGWQMVRMA